MSRISDRIRAYVNDWDVSDHYGEWGILRRDQRRLIRELCDTCDAFERMLDELMGKQSTNGIKPPLKHSESCDHYVKILPRYYVAVDMGIKTFEIRFNDRQYKVGDLLHLQEYFNGKYTGREITREICYLIDDPNYCKEGFVVLGLKGGAE